ncbi:MAG: amidohydrolase [Gammaproteobacteria bacterium]|nr:amidohydrolase [Gammaproteobacteria bacterium]
MPVVDLKGRLVLPGLHDVHMHPLEAGLDVVSCILDADRPIAEQRDTIAGCADQGEREWVLGWGHSLRLLEAAGESPLAILDELIPDRPAAFMEETSHSVWVNSKALELAGIDAATPHPQGGAILKDRRGMPNGILLDAAGDAVFDLALPAGRELAEHNYAGLLHGLKAAAENGITSLVDARVYWRRGYLAAWQRAEREGKLSARASLSLWAYPGMDDEEQLGALKAMYRDEPGSLLRVNQVKFYADGVLHNTTAALHQPYRDYYPEVGPYGLNYFTEERLARYITELEKTGFDAHVHAIGDRGVHEALNAIETAREANGMNPGARHRLTHLELVDQRDRPRFKALGVIADMQVAGDFALPQNHGEMEPLIGERAYEMLPLRSLWEAGARLTLSSDWDVSALSPFVGMQHALQLGEESLPDLASAVQAYTLDAAHALHQENQTGSLEVGKAGDLVVLDQDIFRLPVSRIGKTKVLMTVLGGKPVYRGR